MTAEATAKPVRVEDKRVVNGHTDINQLAPFKYPWAWDFFLRANKNHWVPLDITMVKDKADYETRLTDGEKRIFENVLAYLTTADILAMRNIGLAVMEKMSAPELQIYQARQVYEEALHSWSYQYCIESIGLEQQEVYNRYRVIPEIYAKIKMANEILETVMDPNIDLTDRDNLKAFVKSYIFFAAIFEGTWFYNGFTPIFALQRAGLMRGTAEQLQYIMRDEILHFSFGIRVVKTIMREENIRVPEEEIHQMFIDAIEVEKKYAQFILPKPVRGYTSELHTRQAMFTMDRRLKALGYKPLFGINTQPVEWLAEQANIRKEKNFFETRVTEYEVGAELSFSD